MRLLDRYLLREFLIPFCYCFTGFLIFWIAFDLFDSMRGMVENHLRAYEIAAYYFFKIPEFLPMAVPVALLLALLYALTHHARYHEITAIRAAGVSLWRLCAPYMAVGALAGAGLFLMNELCAPQAADKADEILITPAQRKLSAEERQEIRKLVVSNPREGRSWIIASYNPVTGEMKNPLVDWQLPDGSRRSISAERAIRTNGVWTFLRVKEFRQTTTNAMAVSLPHAGSAAFPEFSETPELIKSQILVNFRYNNKTRTHRADIPLSAIRNYLRLNPHPEPGLRSWLYTKLYGRFALAFTCVVVVVIAVPFAAASGRRNVFVGVAASITIFFVYFLLQQFGFAFGESGQVAPWLGAWLPNIVFGITGLWRMARVR